MEEHGCALGAEEVKTQDHRQTDTQIERERERESLRVMSRCVKLVQFMCQRSCLQVRDTLWLRYLCFIVPSLSPLVSPHLISTVKLSDLLPSRLTCHNPWVPEYLGSYVIWPVPGSCRVSHLKVNVSLTWLPRWLSFSTASHLRKLAKRKTTKALLSVQDLYTQKRSSPAKRTSWCGQGRKSRSAQKSQ